MKIIRKILILATIIFISNNVPAQSTYEFIGDGSWKNSVNWLNRIVPPSILLQGDSIKINPIPDGECILDTLLLISYNAILSVQSGKKMKIVDDFYTYFSISDTLTIQEDSVIASAPTRTFQLSEIYSPNLRIANALSTSQYNNFQSNVSSAAILLCDTSRSDFHFLVEGTNRPSQRGLAYVSSGNNYYAKWEQRFNNGTCSEYLHGLECNGFVSRVFLDAGVKLKNDIRLTTGQFKDTNALNKTLRASPLYNNLKYLPGVLLYDLAQVNAGDIIYWNGHVGICLRYPTFTGAIYVYQSNGSPSDCIRNKAQNNRGCHAVLLSTIISWPSFSNYYISKLVDDADSSFTDTRDGQVYSCRTIGSQVWMTQNLNYVPRSSCYNNSVNCGIYGRLYNWNTALTAAPPGWHLPTDAEWTTLINFLGGESTAGGSMKTITSWNTPNTGATNRSCFNGLPGGNLFSDGTFFNIGNSANWWSSTPYDSNYAFYRTIDNGSAAIFKSYYSKTDGFSVRCVRN